MKTTCDIMSFASNVILRTETYREKLIFKD